MRYFVLSNKVFFSIGSFHPYLLKPRFYFKDVSFVNKDYAVRIVDGYVVFALNEYMCGRAKWTRLHEFMFHESLIGLECSVKIDGKHVLGTIVEIDVPERKLGIRLNPPSPNTTLNHDTEIPQSSKPARTERQLSRERSTSEIVDEISNGPLPFSGARDTEGRDHTSNGSGMPTILSLSRRGDAKGNDPCSSKRRGSDSSTTQVHVDVPLDAATSSRQSDTTKDFDSIALKYFDFKDVFIYTKPGLCRVHVNGMSFRMFNASKKYRDLAEAAGATLHSEDSRGTGVRNENRRASDSFKVKPAEFRQLMSAIRRWFKSDVPPVNPYSNTTSLNLAAAFEAQQTRRATKNFTQRFFNLFSAIEVECFGSAINIGGVGPDFPYFLRLTFQRGEGRLFLTRDGCPEVDPYRIAAEMTLQQVDVCMARMDSNASDGSIIENPSLRDRARIVFRGIVEGLEETVSHTGMADTEVPDLIRGFGVALDGKDKSNIHLLVYHDVPNVYAGEVVDGATLPKTGVEVIIDSPSVRFSPWLMYCYTKLWYFFNPPNYCPLKPLEFVIGKPRPSAGVEFLVEFMQKTRIEIPFKCCKPAPSPPFGITDSNKKGIVWAELGAGSQFIKKASFLLPGQKKQNFETFFSSTDMTIYTNAVLERDTVFCHFEKVQFFLDRQDDLQWNGRKLWNIILKPSGAKVNIYMCYIDFFRDLINNFYYAENLYHNVPLTTESYNTYARVVRDFVPNVKQFEIFADDDTIVSINANTRNVVYSEDPNDPKNNTFGILKAKTIEFRLVLPNDQYQLSYVNEIERPFSLLLEDVKLYISLPPSHPFYKEVDTGSHFGHADTVQVKGAYIVNVENQAIPQGRNHILKSTDRTKCTNYLNIAIEIQNLRGALTGLHIKVVLDVLNNLVLQNPLTIRPDQLFWLPANQESHTLTCRNRESQLRQYLASSCPNWNELEVCVELQFINNVLSLTAGKAPNAPGVSLSTSLACLTVVKQVAVTDITFTLNPVMAQIAEDHAVNPHEAFSFLTFGPASLSVIRHYGRLPYRPMVHETFDVRGEYAVFELSLNHLVMLLTLFSVVGEQLQAEDVTMEVEMGRAQLAAESYEHHDWGDLMASSPPGDKLNWLKLASPNPNDNFCLNGRGQPPPDFAFPPLSLAMNAAQSSPVAANATAFSLELGAMQNNKLNGVVPFTNVNGRGSISSLNAESNRLSIKEVNRQASHTSERLHNSENGTDKGVCATLSRLDGQARVDMPVKSSIPPIPASTESLSPTLSGAVDGSCQPVIPSIQQPGNTFVSSSDSSDVELGKSRTSITGIVQETPCELGQEFEKFMEEVNRAEDHARDYGIFFANFSISKIQGVVHIGKEGLATLDLPFGIAAARSTVNDGNSNKRASAAAQSIQLRMLTPRNEEFNKYVIPVDQSAIIGDFVEVFCIQTSLCSRYYMAYPFDGSLANHQRKQRAFVIYHDYEDLLQFPLPMPPPPPTPNGVNTSPKGSPARRQSSLLRRNPLTVVKVSSKQPSLDDVRSRKNRTRPSSLTMLCTANLHSPRTDTAEKYAHTKGTLFSAGRLSSPKDSSGSEHDEDFYPHGIGSFEERSDFRTLSGTLTSTETSARQGGETPSEGLNSPLVKLPIPMGTSKTDNTPPPTAFFATCISGSEPSTFSEESLYTSTIEVFPDQKGFQTTFFSTSAGSDPKPPTDNYVANERVPLYAFYRTYFKKEPNESVSMRTDYRAQFREESSHSAHPCALFNGPAPSVDFVPSPFPSRFPAYLTAERVAKRQVNTPQVWPLRCTDHRERSETGTTSKHLHVEALEPLTILVTPQAVILGASALAIVKESMLFWGFTSPDSSSQGPVPPPSNSQVQLKKHGSHIFSKNPTKKSHTRTQQMRWLSEDFIVDVTVPCIELKLLTALPLSEENLPKGSSETEGMYCSTLCICDTQLVSWQSYPPVGVEADADSSHKWCASLHIATISVISQIEYEPIARDGGLHIKVPGVLYDMSKDTIAVFYLMPLVVRARKYKIHVLNGGVCSVMLDKVSAHITRDFFSYIRSLRELAYSLELKIMVRLKSESVQFQPFASPYGFSSHASSFRSKPGCENVQSSEIVAPTPSSYRSRLYFNTEQTIQGKISIDSIRLSFIDTKREGKFFKVNLDTISSVHIMQIKGRFSVMSPQQRNHNRVIRVYCLGGVSTVRLELYPIILHVLNTKASSYRSQPSAKPTTASSDGVSNSKTNFPTMGDSKTSDTSGVGLSALGGTTRWGRLFTVAYSASITLQTFSVCLMQSKMNFIEFKGNTLTGFVRKQSVKISSRECIRAEVLTEMISERLKRKLRRMAQRARERAACSRYASPPLISEQLKLTSTAYFFFQQLSFQYIADAFVSPKATSNPSDTTAPNSANTQKRQQDSKVLDACINQGSLAAEFTEQSNIPGGTQLNVITHIVTISLDYPYRPSAVETIGPQAHVLLSEWTQALTWLFGLARQAEPLRPVREAAVVGPPGKPGGAAANVALTVCLQAREMGATVGLSQSIAQGFLLPEFSLLAQRSSNGCVNAKAHAHPFTITAKTNGVENYSVVLPNLYLIFAQDNLRLTSALLMESIAMTVTPLFINHLFLAYQRFTSEIVVIFSKTVPAEELHGTGRKARRASGTCNLATSSLTDAPVRTRRRKAFLFLLQSVRVCYLTSMLNLRLAIQRLNITGESSERLSTSTLFWLINVTGTQVALVDRDDHDQMMAAVKTITQNTKPQNPTTKVLLSSVPPSPYHLTNAVNSIRISHPLGGFIWGSAEFSFSLCIGKTDSNRALEKLKANACFNSYSADLQKALLDSLKHFSYEWELSIYSPLIIVRFGLVDLLQKCIQETQQDIINIRRAEETESMHYDKLLKRKKTFRLLQARKKRYEALIKRAEEKRASCLLRITQSVEKDVKKRRMPISFYDAEEEQMLLSFLDIIREYKCVATVFNFQLVLPFGDAAFRSVLEKSNDIYSCGKVERHIHSSTCLDRLKFIPTLALKLRIENTSFISSFESVRRFTPEVKQPQELHLWGEGPSLSSYTSTPEERSMHINFTGRFMLNDMFFYITDGTPAEGSSKLMNLSHKTTVLGGLGELTAYALEEFHRSHNTIFIACVEAPFNVERKPGITQVRAVMDLLSPKIQISPQLFSILNELAKESHTGSLHDALRTTTPPSSHVNPDAADEVKEAATRKSRSRSGIFPRKNRADAKGSALRVGDAPDTSIKDAEKKIHKVETMETHSDSVLNIDVSARFGVGKMSIFSHTIGTDPVKADPTSKSYAQFSRQRRFGRKFTTVVDESRTLDEIFASSNSNSMTTSGVMPSVNHISSPYTEECNMSCILSIPLPSVIVEGAMRSGGAMKMQSFETLRIEVRAGIIVLSPCITVIAQEIEYYVKIHGDRQQKCRQEIFSRVQALEKEMPQQNTRLHCSLIDLLLPAPRAFASALWEEEMRNAIQIHCASTRVDRQDALKGAIALLPRSWRAARARMTSPPPAPEGQGGAIDDEEGARTADCVAKSFTAIHVTLTNFCIRFTTEPISSTALTVFLDECGSIDVILNFTRHPNSPHSRLVHDYSVSSVIICVQHLRAEVQKKLEVKSLEVFLSEAEATISWRSDTSDQINHLAVNFPFNAEQSDPVLVVRMQHLSQVFTVLQLWTVTTSYTLKRVRTLFARGAPANLFAQRVAKIPVPKLLWSRTGELRAGEEAQNDRQYFMVLCMSHIFCRMDLGSGNSHQLFLSKAHIAAECVRRAGGNTTYLLNTHFSAFSVRSEGLLSGVAGIRGISCRAFLIRNPPDAGHFMRSPDGRTFRAAVIVRDVNLTFKERQLRDVFESKVEKIVFDAMDGVEEADCTTVNLNVLLSKGTLGITPSTMPSLLTLVLSISQIISNKKQVAMSELQKPFPKQVGSTVSSFREIAIEMNKPFWRVDSLDARISEPRTSDRLPATTAATMSQSENQSSSMSNHQPPIPFMGSKMFFLPCGQIRFMIKEVTAYFWTTTTFDKGSIDCVVMNFPVVHLSYAESPCEDSTIAKKILIIQTHDTEMYRPGSSKVVILGLKGVNSFEFFTRQVIGEAEMNFALTLQQTHPWTGNPHFTDFEDIFALFRSFTKKKTANVFHRFGEISELAADYDMRVEEGRHDAAGPVDPHETEGTPVAEGNASDPRILKPLRSTKFSPQMAFGGDVSVNMEVILNWLGITERMLPNVLNSQLCDMLEHALYNLSKVNKNHAKTYE
ncbi:unnamed protein product [Phytomonas sp. EM1]|nr:unnamed protein product [Phytomonas sp. EM1]|eukprot:CCW64969.1 unnamed protein product [Phytomonas sp. isolate EM1]